MNDRLSIIYLLSAYIKSHYKSVKMREKGGEREKESTEKHEQRQL